MSTKPTPPAAVPTPALNPNLIPAPPLRPSRLCGVLRSLFSAETAQTQRSQFRNSAAGSLAALSLLLAACQTPPPQSPTSASPSPLPDTIERRVVQLKLTLPPANKPSATLTPVVVSGNLAFVSGHISRAADGQLITGRVGEELTLAQGKDAARQCGLAVLASLRQELGSLDRVRRVVKVLGMVNCPPGFKDQPQVVNGFSELMLDVFGRERGLGARSAVGVGSLPSNVAVEVEAVFEIVP